jgi:hypothetical protein
MLVVHYFSRTDQKHKYICDAQWLLQVPLQAAQPFQAKILYQVVNIETILQTHCSNHFQWAEEQWQN